MREQNPGDCIEILRLITLVIFFIIITQNVICIPFMYYFLILTNEISRSKRNVYGRFSVVGTEYSEEQ